MPRAARPDDVYRLLVPSDPRLSPDAATVAFSVTASATGRDGYRTSIWSAPVDGSAPARRLTMGPKADHHPRFAPDGRTLAFLSDRRLKVEDEPTRPTEPKDRRDAVQVHLLPLDGGEARRLTDLPRGVDEFAFSPDGRQMVALSSSLAPTIEADEKRRGRLPKPKPAETPLSDYRYIDRLEYQLNGAGFVDEVRPHLWLVDVATGDARLLLAGATAEAMPAWSPDGTKVALCANRHADPDLHFRGSLFTIDVASGRVTTVAGGSDAVFWNPVWMPDGKSILALGDRFPRVGYRTSIWRFAADGSEAATGTDLLATSELKPDAAMNSDITKGEGARIRVSADGRHALFMAPVEGSYELWRVGIEGGKEPKRVTEDRHYLSGWDTAAVKDDDVVVAIRSAATTLPEVVVLDAAKGGKKRGARAITALNAEAQADIVWVEPVERRWTVDGREIQGWLLPAGDGVRPLAVEIHGGPHTLYGWSPVLEWQVLAGAGISVLASNPRGSDGYGEAFNRANLGDWGDGPMADVMAGVDACIADGLADPERLGVTGGSYGGYLTNWIVGKTDRFKAALTCRSVVDMKTLFLTGDISGGEWTFLEFGHQPWDEPGYFDAISPLTYARNIRTPLLIQHAERDLRCTVGQAEALFTVLRSLHRPVRFMRVPDESHELVRSGAPFRRAENLVQVHDWFVHFLVKGEHRMPPVPRNRAGR